MRLVTVKFDEPSVKGEIQIGICGGRERLKLLKEINLTPDADGTIKFNNSTIDAITKGADIVEKNISKVDLIVNDEKIETFEDLEYSGSFNVVIIKLIGIMLNGPERLGK